MSRLDFNVSGMTCAACASRIERVLNRLPGVHAEVNFATETALVTVPAEAAQGVNESTIIAAIERAGYTAVARAASLTEAQRGAELLHEAEYQRDRSDLLLSAALSLPLAIEMLAMLLGKHGTIPAVWQLFLTAPIQFWIGRRFYAGAFAALRGGSANMDVLIALGTSAAWFYSAFNVWRMGAHAEVFFEASAAIIVLVLLGKTLETRAKRRAAREIDHLLALAPQHARVERNGVVTSIEAAALHVGDTLVIGAGEAIAADGEVFEGELQVNESMLTGEAIPVRRVIGEPVFAGTTVEDGFARVRVTGAGDATQLAAIARRTLEAQGSKAPIQRLADRVSAVFVPIVVALAVLTFAVTFAVTAETTERFGTALQHAIAVLVIACPCALGLATPTAIMVGIGVAARHGLLFRDAQALELVRGLDVLVVDKTGTLTLGKPAVQRIISVTRSCTGAGGYDDIDGEDLVLATAASLSRGSQHPLSKAIASFAAARHVDLAGETQTVLSQVETIPGHGVRGQVDGEECLMGEPEWVARAVGWVDAEQKLAADHRVLSGMSIVAVARAGKLLGWIGIADRPRETSAAAVARLRRMGLQVVMLTGDNAASAQAIGNAVGITDVQARLTPEGKASVIAALQREGKRVGMVGDGVNDAPALATATVSFAMGGGSATAIGVAAVTLLREDLNAVADAIELSRATMAKIQQNLFFAFVYNVIGIPIAAIGMLNPVIAGAAMAASSLSVVTNSLLLRRWHASTQNANSTPSPTATP